MNVGHVRIIHVVRQLQMHERRATPPTATATMVRDRTNERGFRGAVEAALCRAALVALKPRDDTDGGHQCAGRRTSVIERRDRAAAVGRPLAWSTWDGGSAVGGIAGERL